MRVLPLSIVCVSNERSSAVEVCAAVSEFFQRTRPPFFTTTVTGLYLKDLMSTGADATGAASVGTGAEAAPLEVVLDCAVMSSLLPGEEPPHPATSTAATRVADTAGFTLLHSPPAPGRITSARDVRLHALRHRGFVERLVERAVGDRIAGQVAEHRRVARLHLHDRAGHGQDAPGEQLGPRPVVGRHARVLELLRHLEEALLARERVAEVDLGRRRVRDAELQDRRGDRLAVLVLVVAHVLDHVSHR